MYGLSSPDIHRKFIQTKLEPNLFKEIQYFYESQKCIENVIINPKLLWSDYSAWYFVNIFCETINSKIFSANLVRRFGPFLRLWDVQPNSFAVGIQFALCWEFPPRRVARNWTNFRQNTEHKRIIVRLWLLYLQTWKCTAHRRFRSDCGRIWWIHEMRLRSSN